MTSNRPLVLVVEDDETLREALSMRIASWGYGVETAADASGAEALLDDAEPDMIVADLRLPDASGLDLVRKFGGPDRGRPVFVVTAHGSIDLAVEAMKEGARDFLTKPIEAEKLRSLLEDAAEERQHREQSRELEARLDSQGGMGSLVGQSRSMQEVFETVELVADSDASVIITGESGTGKEVVARMIHEKSRRADGPFVAVNAAAMPEGLIESELFGHEEGAFTGAVQARAGCFEQADGGTLLLDELAEMPMELQPKLLRILEEGRARRLGGSEEVEFDVRILACTNRDAEEAVEEGDLREDLFYRLNVFHVHMPPLRERTGDVPLLAQHFVRAFNEKHGTSVTGLDEAAREELEEYHWPGNVRELRNVMERGVILVGSGLVEAGHLPPYVRRNGGASPGRVVIPVGTTAARAEKRLILRTLEATGGNKAEAARRLDLDPKTIRNKLKRWESEDDGDDDG